MNCSKCGVQNIDGVTFCGSCGARMESYIKQIPQNEDVSSQHPSQSQYQQQSYGSNFSQERNISDLSNNSPSNGGMITPKNYMVESIIVTIISFFCCCSSPISVILGIIAMVKASKVNPEFERGNINEAISCSESAKKYTTWAAIIAIIFAAICWIAYFSFINSLIKQSGGLEEFIKQYGK